MDVIDVCVSKGKVDCWKSDAGPRQSNVLCGAKRRPAWETATWWKIKGEKTQEAEI